MATDNSLKQKLRDTLLRFVQFLLVVMAFAWDSLPSASYKSPSQTTTLKRETYFFALCRNVQPATSYFFLWFGTSQFSSVASGAIADVADVDELFRLEMSDVTKVSSKSLQLLSLLPPPPAPPPPPEVDGTTSGVGTVIWISSWAFPLARWLPLWAVPCKQGSKT